MFTDNTLTPKEAVRLCALGILADGPATYAALAASVRHFVSHIIGPSLDVMGQSIELLKYEGLVDTDENTASRDEETLSITEMGRTELKTLLLANVRHGATELNKLVVALKFRFMHTLSDEDRVEQIDLLIDMFENEQVRLETLMAAHARDEGFLGDWLAREMDEVASRVSWLNMLKKHS